MSSLKEQQSGSLLIVDLERLEKVDSSAVSMMLAWVREARRNEIKVQFTNVPHNLISLANLYGVAELLMLTPAE
jgi:phospholipid transport system transporter-binding protein